MNNEIQMMQNESKSIKLLSLVEKIKALDYMKTSKILQELEQKIHWSLTKDEKNTLHGLIDIFLFILKNNKRSSFWVLPRYVPSCSIRLKNKIFDLKSDQLELLYFQDLIRIVVEITEDVERWKRK